MKKKLKTHEIVMGVFCFKGISTHWVQSILKIMFPVVAESSSRRTTKRKLVLLTSFKTSSRSLQDTFKTSFKASLRCLQNVSKTYHSRKIVLVNNSPILFQKVLQRRFALVKLKVQFFQEWTLSINGNFQNSFLRTLRVVTASTN